MASPQLSWHHTVMKSSILIALSVIVVSIACTYKSAGSQPVTNNNVAPQTETPVKSTPQTQEKVPCTLTLNGSPSINGLRLGMTPDEVLALFPGSKDDAEVEAMRPASPLGESELLIRPAKYNLQDQFPDITQISLNLLDGRVQEFRISYKGPKWRHVDEFVAKFVKGTNLPSVDQWDGVPGLDNQMKNLKCKDFDVHLFAGGATGNLNRVDVNDLQAEKKLEDRRAKAEAKGTPKPKQ